MILVSLPTQLDHSTSRCSVLAMVDLSIALSPSRGPQRAAPPHGADPRAVGRAGLVVLYASDPHRFVPSGFTSIAGDDLAGLGAIASVPLPATHVRALYLHQPLFKYVYEAVEPEVYDAGWARAVFEVRPEVADFPLGLMTLDPSGYGVCFAFSSGGEETVSDRQRQLWNQIGCHIGAAYRLRRALGEAHRLRVRAATPSSTSRGGATTPRAPPGPSRPERSSGKRRAP